MRLRTLSPAIALLLLEPHKACAMNGWPFYSSGQMDPCPDDPMIRATSFDASLAPSNGSLSFSLGDLETVSDTASLSIDLLIADSDKKYSAVFDRRALGLYADSVDAPDPTHTNIIIPSALLSYLELYTRVDVKFRLGLNEYSEGSGLSTTCVETVLRSGGASGEGNSFNGQGSNNATFGNGGSNSTNSTSNGGDNGVVDLNNSTSNDGDDGGVDSTDDTSDDADASPDGQTQDSGASMLQAAWYLSLCFSAMWLL